MYLHLVFTKVKQYFHNLFQLMHCSHSLSKNYKYCWLWYVLLVSWSSVPNEWRPSKFPILTALSPPHFIHSDWLTQIMLTSDWEREGGELIKLWWMSSLKTFHFGLWVTVIYILCQSCSLKQSAPIQVSSNYNRHENNHFRQWSYQDIRLLTQQVVQNLTT